MPELKPPVEIANDENKKYAEFVKNVVCEKNYCDYSEVGVLSILTQ